MSRSSRSRCLGRSLNTREARDTCTAGERACWDRAREQNNAWNAVIARQSARPYACAHPAHAPYPQPTLPQHRTRGVLGIGERAGAPWRRDACRPAHAQCAGRARPWPSPAPAQRVGQEQSAWATHTRSARNRYAQGHSGPGFDGLGALADYLLIEKELRRAAGHLRTYWYSCHR